MSTTQLGSNINKSTICKVNTVIKKRNLECRSQDGEPAESKTEAWEEEAENRSR